MNTTMQNKTAGEGDYADALVRELGIIFSNAALYGPTHQVTLNAFKACLDQLQKQLQKEPDILFALTDEHLTVDGHPIESKGPGQSVLTQQMSRLGINGLSLMRGLTLEEFACCVEALSAKADKIMAQGGLAQVLERQSVTHIRVKQMSFKVVTEDEVVVAKDRVGTGGATGTDESITSFLQQAVAGGPPPPAPLLELKQATENVPHLAELVVQAARVAGGDEPEAPAGLNERITAAVKALAQVLQQDSSAKSPTGKKALAKVLAELGECLRTLMNRDAADRPLDETLTAALEKLTDHLQIEALASEYLKKRTLIDKSEKRMVELVRTADTPAALAELRERMMASGLTEEDWSDLVRRGQPAADETPSLRTLKLPNVDSGVFQGLMDRLNERLKSLEVLGQDAPASQIQEVMNSLDEEMAALVARVEKKIKALSETDEERAEAERAKSDETARRRMLERRRRMEIVAEIAQEFCQPLTVIAGSVDMLRQCRAGLITEQQGALLSLAARSSERMDGLINDLIEICGMPDQMTPARTGSPNPAPSAPP